MQRRGLPSMLLEPIPPFISLLIAYPSKTVDWPEKYAPTDSGPDCRIASLNFLAARSSAASHPIATNRSPFRSSGVVKRSPP